MFNTKQKPEMQMQQEIEEQMEDQIEAPGSAHLRVDERHYVDQFRHYIER